MTDKNKINVVNKINAMNLITFSELPDEDLNLATSTVLASNPTVSWAKFVLTDAAPNQNKQRVPKEEFKNLISSGLYMPLKMAIGEIKDGHEDARPLGVITNLREEGDTIMALAAMWSAERPDDIQLLKTRLASNSDVEISWEILYGHSVLSDEGVESIYDLTLRAATIVGVPAYTGRTPVTAIAGAGKSNPRKWSKSYLSKLSDDSFLYLGREEKDKNKLRLFPYKDVSGNVNVARLKRSLRETAESNLPENELKSVRVRAKRLLAAIDAAKTPAKSSFEPDLEDITLDKLEELTKEVVKLTELQVEKTALVTEKTTALEAKTAELNTLLEEVVELREYKASIEADNAKIEKLAAIAAKFTDAGLNEDDDYFAEKQEALLALDDESLDFMIQELVAFASKTKNKQENDESDASLKIPNLVNNKVSKTDISALVEGLRSLEDAK